MHPDRQVRTPAAPDVEDEDEPDKVPTAQALLDSVTNMGRAQDVLEEGWIRMSQSRLQAWTARRGGRDRYESYVREQLRTINDEDPVDVEMADVEGMDLDGLEEAGDYGELEDGELEEGARLLREREWRRRQDDVNDAFAAEENLRDED
ncbi:hypothetical protein CF319_g8965 [Tilletia indica]|nr:hypothetical protein CF319_g8965 [Tilletia indica]